MSTPIVKIEDKKVEKKIDEGSRIKREMDALADKLSVIKSKLDKLIPGKYITKNGSSLTISESPIYSKINPDEAKQALKKKRLGKNFKECVTVNITCLKRYLSDTEIEELRKEIKRQRKYSFK